MKSQAPIRLNLPNQIFQALLSQKLVHLMGSPWSLGYWMIGWLDGCLGVDSKFLMWSWAQDLPLTPSNQPATLHKAMAWTWARNKLNRNQNLYPLTLRVSRLILKQPPPPKFANRSLVKKQEMLSSTSLLPFFEGPPRAHLAFRFVSPGRFNKTTNKK